MNFEKMSLAELAKFWNKDWESESPELENPTTMRAWDEAVLRKSRMASELDVLKFLHLFEDEEWFETLSLVRRNFILRFTESLEEEMKQIRTSVEVLLKEHEHEQAKITIGQLNRLKGGL